MNSIALHGIEAERERQGVPADERQRPECRAPDDPAQLPSRSDRPHAAERAGHHHEARDQAHCQVHELATIDHQQHSGQRLAVSAARDRRDVRAAEEQRREIQQRNHAAARVRPRPGVGTIREHQREVQEQRRQQQPRDRISPVEHPVERVEAPRVRERQHAEERHAQPEEMQRRLVVRLAQPHSRAHEQREDSNRGEHAIERQAAGRNVGDPERQGFLGVQAENHVGQGIAAAGGVQRVDDVVRRLDGASVDRQEDVADAHGCAVTGRSVGHDTGGQLIPFDRPEDAIGHLGPGTADGDIGGGQAEQSNHGGDLRHQPRPRAHPEPVTHVYPCERSRAQHESLSLRR